MKNKELMQQLLPQLLQLPQLQQQFSVHLLEAEYSHPQ